MAESKKSQVYQALLFRLRCGYYGFGERILAKQICEDSDASRFVVNAALNELRTQGFVRVIPQVGCEVVQPTRCEVHDFFVMLSRLEGILAEFAAERRPEIELQRARQINSRLLQLTGTEIEQGEMYRLVNAEFHGLLHEWAQSPALAERQMTHWAMADFLIAMAPNHTDHAGDSAREHENIIEAIEAENKGWARNAMEMHILQLGQNVLRHLDQTIPAGPNLKHRDGILMEWSRITSRTR